MKLLISRIIGALFSIALCLMFSVESCEASGFLHSVMDKLPFVGGDSEHVKVVREIMLPSNQVYGSVSIAQTHDGGFVLAGAGPKGSMGAFVTKINGDGKVQWQKGVPFKQIGPRDYSSPKYNGATVLSDGSIVAFGSEKAKIKDENRFETLGLITHIDKYGHVLNQRLLHPSEKNGHVASRFGHCWAVGSGGVLLGSTEYLSGPAKTWVIGFDLDLNIRWEKLSSVLGGNSFRILKNNNIVMTSWVTHQDSATVTGTNVVIMNSRNGDVVKTAVVPPGLSQIVPTFPNPYIPLMGPGELSTKKLHLYTLNDQLSLFKEVQGVAAWIDENHAFYLPNRSLVLFGRKSEGVDIAGDHYTAAIEWVKNNLSKSEIYVFQPKYASSQIDDAIPLEGHPENFVVSRNVSPTQLLIGWNEKQDGTILSFVKIQ